MGLSVIIPIADGDEAWKKLLPDLRSLTEEDEIIFSSKTLLKEQLEGEAKKLALACGIHWVESQIGRAKQLNTGANSAEGDFLWFLHCDSKINLAAIEQLKTSIGDKPDTIHYFDLKFLKDGPRLMVSNSYGVWLRSHILRLPFGDQGFCMHRDVFSELGGFCEKAPYGEDHLFVWKAHQNRIKLNCVNVPIYTSARRYHSQGWLKTTARHIALTVRQATPELIRLIKMRMFL